MTWMLFIGCGLALLLGLFMRLPSVIAASAALVLSGSIVLPLAGWPALAAIAYLFALVSALQCGFLIGVGVSQSWTMRNRTRMSRYGTE